MNRVKECRQNGMRENLYQLHLMQGGHGKDIQRTAKLNTVLNQTNNSQKIKNNLQINVSNYNGNANENHVEVVSHPVRMIDSKVMMTLDRWCTPSIATPGGRCL